MQPLISLCMIVKNEEKVLNRCLDSVSKYIADIVIVDTGSTDETKTIAKKYTNKVYDFEWTNSFADARNYAQEFAEGRWILVLDADEYVDEENLKETIRNLDSVDLDSDAFTTKIINFSGLNGEKVFQHHSIRMYRNNGEILYFRGIHEQIKKNNGELKDKLSSLVIYHTGYMTKTVAEKNKSARNLALLEKEINKEDKTPFDYFNLGNEYQFLGETEKALNYYQKAYQGKNSITYSWVPFSVVQIINCLLRLEKYEEARVVADDAGKYWDLSPEFKYLKAFSLHKLGRRQDAEHLLMMIVQNQDKYKQFILLSIDYVEFHPHVLLGEIYKDMNRQEDALKQFSKALSFNKYDFPVLKSFIHLLLQNENSENVFLFLQKHSFLKTAQQIMQIVKASLQLNCLELLEQVLNQLENVTINDGIRVKQLLLQQEYHQAYEILETLKLEEIVYYINSGYFDVSDISIICIQAEAFGVLKRMQKEDRSLKDFFLFVSGKTEILPAKDKDQFISLLDKCIDYRLFELFESYIVKHSSWKTQFNLEIGHLLYKNKFQDLAFDYYQKVRFDHFDKNTYSNVVAMLLTAEQHDEALNILIDSFNRMDVQYDLLIQAVQICKKIRRKDFLKELSALGLKLFPDSNYLRKTILR